MSEDKWRIVAGPREYTTGLDGEDILVGWAWDIEPVDGGDRRVVRVEVAGGAPPPTELFPALRAKGKPMVADSLADEAPPKRIVVSSSGIVPT